MASASLQQARAAIDGGNWHDDVAFIGPARGLAQALGTARPELGTFRAIYAVLRRSEHDTDREAWEAYGAKGRTYQLWKKAIQDLEAQSTADSFLTVNTGMAMMAIAGESLDREGTIVWATRELRLGPLTIPAHTPGVSLGPCPWAKRKAQVKWQVPHDNMHAGHTCDDCRQIIIGTRYHLTGHNYDLCTDDFRQLEASERRGFVAVAPSAIGIYSSFQAHSGEVTTGSLDFLPGAFREGQTVWASRDVHTHASDDCTSERCVCRQRKILVPQNLQGTVVGRVPRGEYSDSTPRVVVEWKLETGATSRKESPVCKLTSSAGSVSGGFRVGQKVWASRDLKNNEGIVVAAQASAGEVIGPGLGELSVSQSEMRIRWTAIGRVTNTPTNTGAVTTDAPPQKVTTSTPRSRRVCAECGQLHDQEDFSKSQWNKGVGWSRCSWCAQGVTKPSQQSRPSSARSNEASRASIGDLNRPFAEGAFRYVVMGKYTDGRRTGQRCVAKYFKKGSVYEKSFFELDIKAVQVAYKILEEWNARKFIDKHIQINAPQVWTMEDGTQRKLLVEPYIENWEKFNSNSGWVTADGAQWSRVMQALSHYSYHVSRGNFVLCDLQGGVCANGAILTDPVIMSHDGRFGVTDLGRDGIRNFFGHHRCNEFCRAEWTKPADAGKLFQPKQGTSMELSQVQTRPSRRPMSALPTYREE